MASGRGRNRQGHKAVLMLHIRVYSENPRWWFGFLNKVAFRQTTDHDGIILYGEEGKDFRVAVAK